MSDFAKALQELLNKHSCENRSNTPDFILARFLYGCLAVFDLAVKQRETWHGFGPREALREALADYAHEAWCGWMKYLFSKCVRLPHRSGAELVIPEESVARWKRQLLTTYADLPEAEKESDRAEADKMLEICRRHAPLKFTNWFLGKRSAVEAVLVEAKRDLKYQRPTRELDVADIMDALDKAGLLQ